MRSSWRTAVCLFFNAATALLNARDVMPSAKYAALAEEVSAAIRYEMADKKIDAISIALVDGNEIVWAQGFGMADPKAKVPATADTVHRVGSVSKLFTDVAMMKLVQEGKVDLDAPVTKYLPNFAPKNRWNKPITVRMMMTHFGGIARETPVGNYFDPTEPTLDATIESLSHTEVVYEPGTRMKYSNAGVAVVGKIIEVVRGKPLPQVVQEELLVPLQLSSSSFLPTPEIKARLAKGEMWTLHGRSFEAPTFELGIAPAGCLYSTVKDLGRFAMFLFDPGQHQLIIKETLAQMWEPQFSTPQRQSDIGLGFFLAEFQGEKVVSHNGAIYGFATQFSVLPEAKLAVAVVATKDFANSVSDRIGHHALGYALALRNQKQPPGYARTEEIPIDEARSIEGHYAAGDREFELRLNGIDRRLAVTWERRSFPSVLRKSGSAYITDSASGYGIRAEKSGDKLLSGGLEFARVQKAKPAALKKEWEGLIGEYGWDHDVLYILERNGRLWCLIEWFEMNPLTQVSADEYKFPDAGLYMGEKLVFKRGPDKRALEVNAANVVFKRRQVGPPPGEKALKLTPTRPVNDIRAEAMKLSPPEEKGEFRKTDLVELIKIDPTLKLDIRYAGTDNFLGTQFYTQPRAFLQRPAAEAVKRANARLKEHGYGLLIFDGYRPWFITKTFHEATPPEHRFLVANPAYGSRHNRGAAVDLTLFDLKTGQEIEMTGTYDEASDRTYPDYPAGTSLQRWHRDLLKRVMESEGFTVYAEEWWHFDYNDWKHYGLGNIPFEEIGAAQ